MAEKKDRVKERIMSHFARAMQDALNRKGWTQSRLKAETGVSVDRYNDREDGREPTLSSAVRIADALEVSLDQLCGRTQYIQDLDNISAGECLELILILLDQLGGNVFAEGDYAEIRFPPSNVTGALCNMAEDRATYEEYYESAMKIVPETNPKPVSEYARLLFKKYIATLKSNNEPITIDGPFGSESFECFNGNILLGPDCSEHDGTKKIFDFGDTNNP